MKIFTAAQIKRWDEFTIREQGLTSLELMQRAATACYEWIVTNISITPTTCFHIFCGPGNNGGDGLALAGLLYQGGYKIKTYLLPGSLSKDNDTNLRGLQKITTEIFSLEDATGLPALYPEDVVIDAMFGIGLNRTLQGIAVELANHINHSGCRVISIDVPSGMLSDESTSDALTISAHHTLTFQQYKTALLLPENAAAFGSVHLLDIGLSKAFASNEEATYQFLSRQMLKEIYKPRPRFAHKGNFGHAYIVAGNTGKMGAAVLAAKACLSAGVGLLTVQVPQQERLVLQVSTPEAMIATDEPTDLSKFAAIGLGPGWGTANENAATIKSLFAKANEMGDTQSSPAFVLDADALNVISEHRHLLQLLPKGSILSPHPKEFDRMFGKSDNDFERLSLALEQAAALQCYIILKGHHSFIACHDAKGYFNSTGNAGMAKGGSGDVLTGILTGLLAQSYSPLQACMLGVYLHGLAADIAVLTHSQEALLATHIIEHIGKAYLQLQS
ncbi:MAG: NAD(P)H-hydrate dehydratase [Sphingobacteriales bacterium]|nr:MAG: NAD(P)H-hydrate dehydratase [Sphingobacteriales bacterium]